MRKIEIRTLFWGAVQTPKSKSMLKRMQHQQYKQNNIKRDSNGQKGGEAPHPLWLSISDHFCGKYLLAKENRRRKPWKT